MKVHVRQFCNRIISLILTILITIGVPVTVWAESICSTIEFIATDSSSESNNTILSDEGNYTYTPPASDSFLVENVTGTISITSDSPIISFSDFILNVPSFDYYKVVDHNDNLRFYQADVFKDPTQTNNFVYIAIYVESSTAYKLHIQYRDDAQHKLYNIVAPLTENIFLYFDSLSTSLCLGADDVSKRLKLSGKTYTYGTFKNINYCETSNNSIIPTALNSVSENSYDEYTDSDGIIKSYVSDHYGNCYLEDGYTVTDDPIVNIIPKELCFILGEHIYIGKEYGFFIRVVVDSINTYDYAVDIMVFDITHTNPSFIPNSPGGSRIQPLFQFKYRATENSSLGIDPSLSQVVIPHIQYDYAEYFLKDIGFRFTLDNPTALNPGDGNYDPYKDDGAFIIQTRVNYSSVKLKDTNSSFFEDTVDFALGFVPFVGDGLSTLSYIRDINNGFGNDGYAYTREIVATNNEANIDTYETNSTDQINTRGNLIKSAAISLNSDEANPSLINVGGGYVEALYVIARKNNSSNNKMRVITSVSVDIVEDNTYQVGSTTLGELTSYGRSTGTYETGSYKRLENITLNGGVSITIPASEQTQIIKITPKVSGSYKICTSSYNGDPNFRITNASKGTSAVIATDDINEPNDKNAVLIIDLIGNDIYYLEAFSYNRFYGYTLSIGYTPSTTQTLTADIPCSVVTTDDSYQMFEFAPTDTGWYLISTAKTAGDPQLFLFSSSGLLLNSDDDSGGNSNALLVPYLSEGYSYYIAVQGYNGASTACSLTAFLQN